MELKDLKFDKRNYRIHTEKNKQLIKRSIDNYGLGRSIVVDNENCIIGGNGVVSQLDENTKIKVIETTGDELVVVKRTDLSTNDPKRKGLAVMENTTSDSGEMDNNLLTEDFDLSELNEFGVEIPQIEMPKEETEIKDLSDKIQNKFEISIECENEIEQEEIFNKLTEQGYKCRILTL